MYIERNLFIKYIITKNNIILKTRNENENAFRFFGSPSTMERTMAKKNMHKISSITAEVTIILPIGESSFPKSIKIWTPTGSAVSEKTMAMKKLFMRPSPKINPRAIPAAAAKLFPIMAIKIACPEYTLKLARFICIPASNKRKKMPSSARISMPFRSGLIRLRAEGPRRTPAIISPIIGGCRMRAKITPEIFAKTSIIRIGIINSIIIIMTN
ncbi:Uncharacterised protein [uncultured archaeon]|nr:Uncharacterised protein [uncultured archaeon]